MYGLILMAAVGGGAYDMQPQEVVLVDHMQNYSMFGAPVAGQPVRNLIRSQPIRTIIRAQPVRSVLRKQPVRRFIRSRPVRRLFGACGR